MDVLKRIKQAGIVGVGGAGFPTHVKYEQPVEYLIVNGAECEPLLQTDQYAMTHEATKLIKTIDTLKKALNAKNAVIATKKSYTSAAGALKEAKEQLQTDVTIHVLDDFYPSGDEVILVYEVTKRVVPPRGIPLMVGCVVSNVTTVLNIHHALEEEKPVTSKRLTVLGHVKKPILLEVPIGISFEACLKEAGGTLSTDVLFIEGGPMMGKTLLPDEIKQKVVTKTTSAILVVKNTGEIKRSKEQSLLDIFEQTKAACIHCSLCTELCPRQHIGHMINPHLVMEHFSLSTSNKEMKNIEDLQGALICSECGVCEVIACPRGLSPRKVNAHIKQQFAQKGIHYEQSTDTFQIDDFREPKKLNDASVYMRLGLISYLEQTLHELTIISADEVRLPLTMHIGKKANPIVQVNDVVTTGQLIAKVPEQVLGANVHASICGIVVDVTHDAIYIKAV